MSVEKTLHLQVIYIQGHFFQGVASEEEQWVKETRGNLLGILAQNAMPPGQNQSPGLQTGCVKGEPDVCVQFQSLKETSKYASRAGPYVFTNSHRFSSRIDGRFIFICPPPTSFLLSPALLLPKPAMFSSITSAAQVWIKTNPTTSQHHNS